MEITLTRLSSILGSGALLTGVLVACSGDTENVSVSAETACNDVATALCEKIESCASLLSKVVYADKETCIARNKINCVSSFDAPGTSATPSRASQCARDAKSASCDDLLGRTPPESCRTLPGTLDDGAACGHDAQCKNKLCRLADSSSCGACSSLGGPGATCERDDECDYGASCVGGKCATRGKVGAACSDSAPCLATLTCVGGVCAAPLTAGAPCTFKASENACDQINGYYCHPKTNVCTAFGTAPPGGQCEFTADKAVVCTASDCKRASGEQTGSCIAPAADGAACDDAAGPKCMAPARCTKGVCTITDPATCK